MTLPERIRHLTVQTVVRLFPRSLNGYGEQDVARVLYPSFSGVYPTLTKGGHTAGTVGRATQRSVHSHEHE